MRSVTALTLLPSGRHDCPAPHPEAVHQSGNDKKHSSAECITHGPGASGGRDHSDDLVIDDLHSSVRSGRSEVTFLAGQLLSFYSVSIDGVICRLIKAVHSCFGNGIAPFRAVTAVLGKATDPKKGVRHR